MGRHVLSLTDLVGDGLDVEDLDGCCSRVLRDFFSRVVVIGEVVSDGTPNPSLLTPNVQLDALMLWLDDDDAFEGSGSLLSL